MLEILITTLAPLVDDVIVAVPAGYEDNVAALLGARATVITGGDSRQHSIDRMLEACTGELVLIQDAARPFASAALHTAVLKAAAEHGAAGGFLDPTVPVGHIENGAVARYQTRQEAGIFQAPQAYQREVLRRAREATTGQDFQSTAQMVIDAGYALQVVPGEPENIKITTALDWSIAQRVIAPQLGLDT